MSNLNLWITAALLALLILNLAAAVTLSAFSRSNLGRLVGMRDQGDGRAGRAVELLHRPERLHTALQFTRSWTSFGMAGLIFAGLLPLAAELESYWISWAGLGVGALLLFLCEEALESRVLRAPEQWTVRFTSLAQVLSGLHAPFLGLAGIFYEGAALDAGVVTEDELKSMLDAGHQEGLLEQGEREMIYSIFKLGDTLAREIMVPRIYITALDAEMSFEDTINAVLNSGYSRLPVYQETIDNILGLLYAKDVLRAWRQKNEAITLRELVRPAYFIPEAKKVDTLLDEMQAQRIHMAIVVDEYGGVAGLVTLEDIVEEIVGEIRDEFDAGEEQPYQVVAEGEYLFLGRIDLDDFNDLMSSHLPRDEAETLGGFIYSQIGGVPAGGETLELGDLTLVVEQVSGRRIRKVRAIKKPTPTQKVEEDA